MSEPAASTRRDLEAKVVARARADVAIPDEELDIASGGYDLDLGPVRVTG